MCGIFGFLRNSALPFNRVETYNETMRHIVTQSAERGRDGMGYIGFSEGYPEGKAYKTFHGQHYHGFDTAAPELPHESLIGNVRAEPTTEYVEKKHHLDQQPYTMNGWSIVHNGTIANDAGLRDRTYASNIDSAAILELLVRNDHLHNDSFERTVRGLKGSYAILAVNEVEPDYILFACNYRPIWYSVQDEGVYFASDRAFFPKDHVPQMMEPYSTGSFHYTPKGNLRISKKSLFPMKSNPKSLVVCSGGMDSVVAAQKMIQHGHEIELIHFQYGSRAEGPEVAAVQAVAAHLGVPLALYPLPVYKPGDSPLLRADSAIAGGEAGAEFAHEWVPARNLVLLAVATAYAEANGFDNIVLGNNMEEAGAYPDNEPEFVHRFNDLLPFAVGDGKRVRVVMPVGGLMKHEIVAMGWALGAPLHLTWSCYRSGDKHCGTCGPCYMRRKAFEINELKEVIDYAE